MSLYVIGDTHLSFGTEKPMDVFGGRWEGYVEKLREGLSVLREEDTLVICGDVSWGLSLEEALEDFRFLASFPGCKLILKGNHDYWWNTVSKMRAFLAANGVENIDFIHNNCYFWQDLAICGTRGWFYEESRNDEHDKKMINRELMRLEHSFRQAGEREKLCFLHYPPRYKDYVCEEFVELIERYGVRRCYYGHIHSAGHRFAVQGVAGAVEYHLISADHIGFAPVRIAG